MNVRLVEAKNKKQVVKKKYLTASFFSCKIGKVIVMEEILKQTLLYDFYGELLTEHQKQVYEDVILNDYSLSEVAASLGISRQGVNDMVRRSSHAQQHDPLPTQAHHQRAPVSSIPPSKSSLPMLLLFDGKHEL